jgi:hypothetical protein
VGYSIFTEVLLQVATEEVLGLDVVNLIMFISKNGEKIPKNHTFFTF